MKYFIKGIIKIIFSPIFGIFTFISLSVIVIQSIGGDEEAGCRDTFLDRIDKWFNKL